MIEKYLKKVNDRLTTIESYLEKAKDVLTTLESYKTPVGEIRIAKPNLFREPTDIELILPEGSNYHRLCLTPGAATSLEIAGQKIDISRTAIYEYHLHFEKENIELKLEVPPRFDLV
ncbi:MAG: hypothetical protein KAT28_00220 [Candidatus Aenigmarchaeota archaeon]|nr:hypothetical protein [Candidatus Aenigmarchaeota archaeon]